MPMASYLHLENKDVRKYINNTVKGLKPYADLFDHILVTGISGMLIGPTIALRLNKKLAIVRKNPKESSHSSNLVEGYPFGKYIIIDDFVSSGETVLRIKNAINRLYKNEKPSWDAHPEWHKWERQPIFQGVWCYHFASINEESDEWLQRRRESIGMEEC